MKIAEAIEERSAMKKKLQQLQTEIQQNLVTDEGEEPEQDPKEMLERAFRIMGDIEGLTIALNTINVTAKLPDGMTIAQARARREALEKRHSMLSSVIAGTRAMKQANRYYDEHKVKQVAHVDVKALAKQQEDIAQEIRELNTRLQAANWNIDI